jgi:quinol monooxygenase YgiN
MRLSFWLHAAIILSAMFPRVARCEGDENYIVSYVEIMPNALNSGSALLNRYRDAMRQQSGNLASSLLHEIGRSGRFAILEVWTDKTAADNRDKQASIVELRHRLEAIQSAPLDERLENELFVEPVRKESPAEAVYVLTHVDIAPEHDADGPKLLQNMRAASAKEQGNLGYEILQQQNRLNHFTIVEEWAGMTSLAAHAEAPHTRAFRQSLLPMEGALYDERRYKELR